MVPELCWSMFGMKLVRYCLYMWLPMYLNQNVRIASFFILFGKIKIWLYVLINLILNLIIHILYMKLDFSLFYPNLEMFLFRIASSVLANEGILLSLLPTRSLWNHK